MFGRISAHGERRALCLAMQLGSNRLLRSPPFSQKQPFGKGTNQRLTEEDAVIVIQQREHYQHPQAAEAPDKGEDQARNGREGQKDEVEGSHAFTRVWHHPGSVLSAHTLLLSWLLVLVFQFQLAALAPRVLQLRGREGDRGQPALLSLLPL